MARTASKKELLIRAKLLLAHNLFLSEKEKNLLGSKLEECDAVAMGGFISVMESHDRHFKRILEKAFKDDKKGKFWAKWISYKKNIKKAVSASVHEKERINADYDLGKELQKI
ncbi:MAG: hypothetical protein WC897_04780 [Candidatus Gracilibacteria bacterium]